MLHAAVKQLLRNIAARWSPHVGVLACVTRHAAAVEELARQLRVARGERDDALQVHRLPYTEVLC